MKKNQENTQTLSHSTDIPSLSIAKKIAYSAIMAALCYVGYAVFPAFNAAGTKVHVGNAFVVLGSLLLGGLPGGLAGAVGLSLADILSGYVNELAPMRTFICKLLIGIITGLVAHKAFHISETKDKKKIVIAAFVSCAAGLLFNCVFEPSLKYIWYTLLYPNPDKSAAAIKALLALTTITTFINAIINTIVGGVFYIVLRPALQKANLFGKVKW